MDRDLTRHELDEEIARASCWSFPDLLERRYLYRCGGTIVAHMGRMSAIIGLVTFAAISLDLSVDKDVFEHAWPWRCAASVLYFSLATWLYGRPRQTTVAGMLYGLSMLAVMAVVSYAGAWGPAHVQDRYGVASVMLFAAGLATSSIPFPAAIPASVLGAVLYSILPILFGAGSEDFTSDLLIGGCSALVVLMIVRRKEIERRRRFLEALRYELAASELSYMNEELLRLSNTDALTGLPNRRFFEAEAARLCADGMVGGLGAIIVDIDHFKTFNDRAGHVAGDVCLKDIAQAVSASFHGASTKIARYGGEEFAALVPSSSPSELELLCENLRGAVSDLKLPHPALPGRNVSVSIGLAWFDRVSSMEPSVLLREADKGLYAAKAAGRDQVAWPPGFYYVTAPSLIPDEAAVIPPTDEKPAQIDDISASGIRIRSWKAPSLDEQPEVQSAKF